MRQESPKRQVLRRAWAMVVIAVASLVLFAFETTHPEVPWIVFCLSGTLSIALFGVAARKGEEVNR